MANKRIALNTKSRKLVMHETMTGYAFMLPFLIFFAMYVPTVFYHPFKSSSQLLMNFFF